MGVSGNQHRAKDRMRGMGGCYKIRIDCMRNPACFFDCICKVQGRGD